MGAVKRQACGHREGPVIFFRNLKNKFRTIINPHRIADRLHPCIANLRLWCKWPAITNALAYYVTELITIVNRFDTNPIGTLSKFWAPSIIKVPPGVDPIVKGGDPVGQAQNEEKCSPKWPQWAFITTCFSSPYSQMRLLRYPSLKGVLRGSRISKYGI